MSSSLLFDFKVDKAARTIYVTREFHAELSLVWDAFTTQEALDQWWAPQPLSSKTKDMDFRVGGRRFYAMVDPEGKEIAWQVFQYTSLTPKSNFKCLALFTDQDETPQLPGSSWDLTFSEHEEITRVSITIYFESLHELENMIETGFKEGFTVTLNALKEQLESRLYTKQ